MSRELLKEAIEVLMRGQDDEQANLAQRIEDYLAAPSESAMELVWQVVAIYRKADEDATAREIGVGAEDIIYNKADLDAAALIEFYGRRVPRAFVEEILDKAWNCLTNRPEGMVLQTIAAKHGVKVED